MSDQHRPLRPWQIAAVVGGLAVVSFVLPSTYRSQPSDTTPTRTTTTDDSAGWLACREWRQLIDEADILTGAEFRSRLQQIEGLARYATTDGLASAVRRTLQASTRDDLTAVQTDMEFITRTCASPAMLGR